MFGHDYGFADRLTHRLALGLPSLAELSFELDQKFCPATGFSEDIARLPHVFVTGLARAGTTIVLRHLHEAGQFRSLTYRDMPFPLAPNLWKRASARWRKQVKSAERAHGDGLAVDSDSPEALEEVFWRIHCGEDYLRADALVSHRPDDRAMHLFGRYVAAILASAQPGQWRYLSKNNNNVLRLPALHAAFPNALFVVPFRHPMVQAMSLWRQHVHFTAMQKETPFVRSYMDWLGHHEFGGGHRPFLLDGRWRPDESPATLEYWLSLWIHVYTDLLRQLGDRHVPLCYEDLCSTPEVWTALLDRLGLPAGQPGRFAFPATRPTVELEFRPSTLRAAEGLYQALRDKAAPLVRGSSSGSGSLSRAIALAKTSSATSWTKPKDC